MLVYRIKRAFISLSSFIYSLKEISYVLHAHGLICAHICTPHANSRMRSKKRRLEVRDWRRAISFPEAAILLVNDGDRDLWPGPTPEVRDSRTSCHSAHAHRQVWQIWLVLVLIYCVYTAIQNRNVVGPGQGSRYFQRMTRGTPGDEVGRRGENRAQYGMRNAILRGSPYTA